MTKFEVVLPLRLAIGMVELQIPPLRYAPVGMTKLRVVLPLRVAIGMVEQQVPPLRSPGFPVGLGGVDALHAPFPYRRAHTWSCPVQRGRKLGYAPVGMTLHFCTEWQRLSLEAPPSPFVIPSEAEGSAVSPSQSPLFMEAPPSTLSSRPERTRISCHAALDKTSCAPFCKGKAHEVRQRHQAPQEMRGSGVEGSAVQRTIPGNVFFDIIDIYGKP